MAGQHDGRIPVVRHCLHNSHVHSLSHRGVHSLAPRKVSSRNVPSNAPFQGHTILKACFSHSRIVFLAVTALVCSIGLFVLVVSVLQKKRPGCLPDLLLTWKFLPLPLRSLAPYDKFIRKYFCFMKRCQKFIAVEQQSTAALATDQKPVNGGHMSPQSLDSVSMYTVDSRTQFKYVNHSYTSDDII